MEPKENPYSSLTREQLEEELKFQSELLQRVSLSNGQLMTKVEALSMRNEKYESYISQLPKEKPEEV